MKIKGLKHLNSNWYDSIMIRNKTKEDIQIDVKSKNVPETLKVSPSFYSKVKHLTNKEIVYEIIRYFLKYNQINCIDNNIYLENYKNNFVAILGSRDLFLKIEKGTFDKKIKSEIINKYILDRNEFLLNNIDVKNIEIFLGDNKSFYDINTDEYYYKNESVLSLRLMNKDRELYKFEEDFLIDFIKYKISSVDEEIQFKYSNGLPQKIYFYGFDVMKFGDYSGNYIHCSKFIINLDTVLFNKIIPLINQHNNELKNIKKLQLTFNV